MNGVFDTAFTFAQYGEFALRIVVACLCGACIGYERSKRLKEAGLRTHLIVCCAAALMMIVSKYGFADLTGSDGMTLLGTKGADPSRIAAQVISGVSFIGAGVIFHHSDNTVKGLTTAAGLWATAGIGITIGAGMYGIGIFTTALIAIIQIVLHKYAIGMDNVPTVRLSFKVINNSESRKLIEDYLDKSRAETVESEISIDEDGYATYRMSVHIAHTITMEELNNFFDENDNVKSISCEIVN